ncbi:hypothetical protein [Lentibacillus sp. Marseille-P4043]|uniref:hypothetical protein n=1 Tax=Lentibacillus sp. Marseille-P4043 TaxID=2040293 RepID=UPI000D0B4194|nr:hypothetical protein [Lentibacillus sp. Marseille-P4043]
MKVFRMNDFDWVCAESEEQAKEWYHNETSVDMKDIEEDFEIWGEVPLSDHMWLNESELPVEELKKSQIMERRFGELWIQKTFGWVIEHEKITKPCIISSTEY